MDQCVQEGVWRTRRQMKLGKVEGPEARAEVECLERGEWLDIIIALAMEVAWPAILLAQLAISAELAMRYVAGVGRASTLRTRCRTWRKVRLAFERLPRLLAAEHRGWAFF
ncbi:unnamed protein product [Polarella glacialis]|uniref:Uncharacterized protein n=1 Tax=Polarella glacialis TaxID=89957 RepID=A0A813EAZ7_POLGL|nr:unnamed protein product [Polarella glacialis]